MSFDGSNDETGSTTSRSDEADKGATAAWTIWLGLALVSVVLYRNRQAGNLPDVRGVIVPALLGSFALVLGCFAWMKLTSAAFASGWRIPPLISLAAGLLTLVPPCIIAASVMPVDVWWTSWFTGGLLVIGSIWLLLLHDGSLFRTEPSRPYRYEQRSASPAASGWQREEWRDGFPDDEPDTGSAASGLAREEDAGTVIQRFQRVQTSTGQDELEGTVRIDLEPDQRQTVVHVPFSPPFSETPIFETELAQGDGLRIKVADVRAYGARIEVRRQSGDKERCTGEIAFIATAPADTRAA